MIENANHTMDGGYASRKMKGTYFLPEINQKEIPGGTISTSSIEIKNNSQEDLMITAFSISYQNIKDTNGVGLLSPAIVKSSSTGTLRTLIQGSGTVGSIGADYDTTPIFHPFERDAEILFRRDQTIYFDVDTQGLTIPVPKGGITVVLRCEGT